MAAASPRSAFAACAPPSTLRCFPRPMHFQVSNTDSTHNGLLWGRVAVLEFTRPSPWRTLTNAPYPTSVSFSLMKPRRRGCGLFARRHGPRQGIHGVRASRLQCQCEVYRVDGSMSDLTRGCLLL
ncbi:hypothetical protein L226DRAFT_164006 [Lentinus tigrinus ALCF2SS1-7]|uniref:uncharacterized protein n=1 Tax=Lentinus tigrinus ALCF2SS1-7 TaxID=1328758 RepID=UPI001165F28E|nr:hypothetical protein L226DRAFT_164006 [Lentinus tigrinus ALCF2SS1-7]